MGKSAGDAHLRPTVSRRKPERKVVTMDMSATTPIRRSPQEVFAYVAEMNHDADWRTGVVGGAMTSSGPMGVGSTGITRAEARGRSMESGWRVTEYEDGSVLRWNLVSGPYLGTGGYICRRTDSGTMFTMESDVRAAGLLRLVGPLFAIIGRRQNRTDVEKLRTILESRDNSADR